MNETDIIKAYEKITKSTLVGRLGNRFFFKDKSTKYISINLRQLRSIVKKKGK